MSRWISTGMRFYKVGRFSVNLSLLLIVIGYGLAVIYSDPIIFSRFGSLIVCVGVFFGSTSIPEIIQKLDEEKVAHQKSVQNSERVIYNLERKATTAEFKKAYADQRDFYEKVTAEIVESIDDSITQRLSNAKIQLLILEMYMVMIGTLIWGFGDLFVFVKASSCS